ncbi:hypothetical protein [Streptomyces sp. N35]|uniref:hypothetical protein n=1 Tax=Streptomyces sp. N35 TaxID=2795730 RepID=UPI0018F76F09|nr:hypothetical protein [Streptomyces sp. N35]
MARIQILELPAEHHGDDFTTPFILVIDEYEYGTGKPIDDLPGLKDATGARGVIVTAGRLDVAP